MACSMLNVTHGVQPTPQVVPGGGVDLDGQHLFATDIEVGGFM